MQRRAVLKPTLRQAAAGVAAVCALAGGGPVAAGTPSSVDSTKSIGSVPLRTPESFVAKRRGLRTIAEILAQNGIQTLGGRFFMEPPSNQGFVISTHTIHENLISGQEWDDNTFSANNYRHPWQGGMYFDAARANGYDFWASSMFSFAGSALWEYTGEAHHPSYNDMINTHVGGIAFGEVMFRLSSMVLDNTATGSNRAWRELGALAISPTRGFNRMFTGEAFKVHANPPDRIPSVHQFGFDVGVRTLGEDRLWSSSQTRMFIGVEGQYGDRFRDLARPFDNFAFGLRLNLKSDPKNLGRILMHGVLGGRSLGDTATHQHIIAAYQDLDYIDNDAYTYGGQSFGVGYQSRFATSSQTALRTALFVNGILLGATKSDYANVSGRDYDYGPGMGFKFVASMSRNGREVFSLAHESYYIHSVSGNDMDSYVNFSTVRVLAPAKDWFTIGVDYTLYHAERHYALYPDVTTRNPELHAYLAWRID